MRVENKKEASGVNYRRLTESIMEKKMRTVSLALILAMSLGSLSACTEEDLLPYIDEILEEVDEAEDPDDDYTELIRRSDKSDKGDASSDKPTTKLPKAQKGVAVATLEEELAGDTYGLLYPQKREAYVGRNYYSISDEESFVIAVHDGLYRGIRGIVLNYDFGNYDYWNNKFNEIVNRSEFGGFVKGGYLVEPEGDGVVGIYPQFNVAWEALTYYRYLEPEASDEAMKVLRAAHKLAEDAIKACPDDEYGIILYVNNAICELTEYADPIPKGIEVPERDATGVFIKGSAVCAGYATAFRLVMEILGIENTVIVNNKEPEDPGYHIWNYVKYEGKWYHVDVTWNDSELNKYFMLTDEELKKKTAGSFDEFAHDWVPLYVY